jgi:hypothetical protein
MPITITTFPTTIAAELGHWQFREFDIHHPTGIQHYNPNKWSIDRTPDDVFIILDERGNEIDTPDDTGQDIFTLVLHGIGWLHSTIND